VGSSFNKREEEIQMNEKGTFMWAIEQMKQGKKVRNPLMNSGEYYDIYEGVFTWTSEGFRQCGCPFPKFKDTQRTDWEIYGEPKQTLWDKRNSFKYHGEYITCYVENDVKEALKKFLINLKIQGHSLDSDSCLSSENYKLAKEIFGEELIK